MVWYVNKGKVVKLCGSNDCLMSGSQKTTKHSVVKDRRPSLPLETLSGQPEDRLHGGQKSNPLGIDSDTDAACEIVFQSRRRNLMTCVMGWGARIWMRLRSAHFVLGLSMVCRETVHAVIENGSANRVASAGSLLLCCSYCRTKYVRMSEPFNKATPSCTSVSGPPPAPFRTVSIYDHPSEHAQKL